MGADPLPVQRPPSMLIPHNDTGIEMMIETAATVRL